MTDYTIDDDYTDDAQSLSPREQQARERARQAANQPPETELDRKRRAEADEWTAQQPKTTTGSLQDGLPKVVPELTERKRN